MGTAVARRQDSNVPSALAQDGETMNDMIHRLAAEESIPVTGITLLGGRPYINTTGLDCKLRSKCESEKLVHAGTEYIVSMEASKENGMRAGGWGVIRLFDKKGFERALELAAKTSPITTEVLQTLKELYHYVFKMRGFASPETLQMANMKLKDNIEHMAERRATNRAKREATGTGLTSVEEMADAEPETLREKNGSSPSPVATPPAAAPAANPLAWIEEYAKAVETAIDEDAIKLAEFNARGHFDKMTQAERDGVKFRLIAIKGSKEQKLASFKKPADDAAAVTVRRAIIDQLVEQFGQERFLEASNAVGLRGDSDGWSIEKLNECKQKLESEPW